jgi:hypothetical protein
VLRDREYELADALRCKRVRCDSARRRIDRTPRLEGASECWRELGLDADDAGRASGRPTIPRGDTADQSTAADTDQQCIDVR